MDPFFVIITVPEKTGTSFGLKKLFFRKSTKYYPVQQRPLPSLGACIIMDLLGYASFGIPVFGELLDIIWAPISAFIFWRMFGGRKGLFGGAFNFFEEIMPGLDIIPTFTIAWFLEYSKRKKADIAFTRQ